MSLHLPYTPLPPPRSVSTSSPMSRSLKTDPDAELNYPLEDEKTIVNEHETGCSKGTIEPMVQMAKRTPLQLMVQRQNGVPANVLSLSQGSQVPVASVKVALSFYHAFFSHFSLGCLSCLPLSSFLTLSACLNFHISLPLSIVTIIAGSVPLSCALPRRRLTHLPFLC